jgi:hypothetical protein
LFGGTFLLTGPGTPTGETKPLQKKVGFLLQDPETAEVAILSDLVKVPLKTPRIAEYTP